MSLHRLRLLGLWLGTLSLMMGGGCKQRPTEVVMPKLSPQLLDEVHAQRQAWRASQDARMRGPLSPLSRIDYQHLPIGEHILGDTATETVHLVPELRAGFVGELRVIVQPEEVSFVSTQPVLHNGEPQSRASLHKGDTLLIGKALILLSGPPTDPGLAVYSESAPSRLSYSGLHYYPDNDSLVVAAKLVRFAPRKVKLLASRGEPQELTAIGDLHFSIGQDCVLEAYLDSPTGNTLFLIFRDQTSGQPGGSYGAGRFLLAKLAADDTAVLDFNQAWNPLCAYSAFFHCPMPSRKNHLPVAILAGEKSHGEH